ncbi:hypothetical protein AMATHDRAFT_76345 [Amanita thiersii Skay4041]|uniref:Peptidase M48 domain-containing protein n=1 Tax=Amanita thiersii Skay4041 TaxID=703135 RepID=A0A2A9NLM8_9AGAR|nr:hypothetical protein AMATHDRAFT_76345 [Amanita thiersii Skay4041]
MYWPLRLTHSLFIHKQCRISLQNSRVAFSTPFLRPNVRNLTSTIPRPARYVRFDDLSRSTHSNSSWSNYKKWDGRIKLVVTGGVLGGVYYVVHLEQVPETGRWRFMNTSPQFEAKVGEYARAQARDTLQDGSLPANHPISRHVRRVVQRILTANNLGIVMGTAGPNVQFLSPRSSLNATEDGDLWDPDRELRKSSPGPGSTFGPEKEWEVVVVNNPKVINAMVVPGMIVVFTGILPVCKDEPGLAAVVSHVARHTAERLSSQTLIFGFFFLMDILGVDFGFSRIVQKLLHELPNSRTQEREADLIGLRLMSRACFDPRASPEMFERLDKIESKLSSRVNLDFLQTHPSSKSRVQFLEHALPEGYAIRASNPECSDLEHQIHAFQDAAQGIRVVKIGRDMDGEISLG